MHEIFILVLEMKDNVTFEKYRLKRISWNNSLECLSYSDNRIIGSIRIKEIDESFRCTFCNCLRWDLSIDTENCTLEWKLLVFCVCTRMHSRKGLYERCCAGTEHESNENDPRKHVNCRTIDGVNRASFHRFYRSKSRFLSKMIKYGAYEINSVEFNE